MTSFSNCNFNKIGKELFTGLVETLGTISEIKTQPPGKWLGVESEKISRDASIGDSICVNGCCLTVVEIKETSLCFEAVEETLNRTNLGELRLADHVNLERSLSVGDRMGGHFVSGHIDGLATLEKIDTGDKWSTYWFGLERELMRQLASKGSIAIDGVSLTLVGVEYEKFSVALIPHTLEVTTLGKKKVGDTVNIETDILAKYVARQLSFMTSDQT